MDLFEENSWSASEKRNSIDENIPKKKKNNKTVKQKIKVLNFMSNGKTILNKKKKKKRKLTNIDIPNLILNKGKNNGESLKETEKIVLPSKIFIKSKNETKLTTKVKSSAELMKNRNETLQAISVPKSRKRKLSQLETQQKQVIEIKKPKISNFIKKKIENTKNKNFVRETNVCFNNIKLSNKAKTKKKDKEETESTFKHEKSDKINSKINIKKIQEMLNAKKKENEKKYDSISLRNRMLAHLRSSRFRFLNEILYKNQSSDSQRYFKDDPGAFIAYHEGYRQQVSHWPLNPLDLIIDSIRKLPKDLIVADFGCGEAKLADSVPQIVHSFDLVAINDKVRACDIAHTPLLKNEVNVVVFCLSLMGTNLSDYFLEANRVLKRGGIMKIAEVESRFENIKKFVDEVSAFGFINISSDLSNDLFYFLDFKKVNDVNRGKNKCPVVQLKACRYKKR